MTPLPSSKELQAGDCLLYKPSGFFGWLISVKTWHKNVSHVEVYDGVNESWASRDGKGVNLYPLRMTELAYVLRPTVPLNLGDARHYARSMVGTPYGWLDLLTFVGLNIDKKGIVCSPFVAEWYRAAGWPVFPTDKTEAIAPFQFLDLVGSGFLQIYPCP